MKPMNVTELARRLKVPTKDLLEILPQVGIDIGRRAIKIDARLAQRVTEQWPRLYAEWRAKQKAAEPEISAAILPPEQRTVTIPPRVIVRELAQILRLPLAKVMGQLMRSGVLSSMNEDIDFDTAAIVAGDLGFEVIAGGANDTHEQTTAERLSTALAKGEESDLKARPPVVVVMGHVDHGKTKLLDAIRNTNVMGGESGGITQHIGAYQTRRNDRDITFIDTPGHEAFMTMRSRGARVADVAILVVAADDGVQEQTKESIKIINSAKLPLVVAINKIDKPDANPERVKQELSALGMMSEDWGGKITMVPISAKTGENIDQLLDMVLLVADLDKDNVRANYTIPAVGSVIEAHVDKGEGPVATVLVQGGVLHVGDMLTVGGSFFGKVRAMKDFTGKSVKEAPPSMPVRISGLKAAPSVGDVMEVTTDVDRKDKLSRYQLQEQTMSYSQPVKQSDDASKAVTTLNLVIRADVLGSLEAIISSITKFEHPEVAVNIIAKGLGNVTDADVERAIGDNATVLLFHVVPTPSADKLAKDKNITLHRYTVIYKLVDDVKKWLEELLKPEVLRHELGRLKVLAVFRKDKDSSVIGGTVTKGKLAVGAKVEILHADAVIGRGTIEQLQLNKIEVREIEQGRECGLRVSGKSSIEVGDILETYTEEVKIKKLE